MIISLDDEDYNNRYDGEKDEDKPEPAEATGFFEVFGVCGVLYQIDIFGSRSALDFFAEIRGDFIL